MVSLASSLNTLQDRFFPREIYDAETGYDFSLAHNLDCMSFYELTLFKEHVGYTPFQGFQL